MKTIYKRLNELNVDEEMEPIEISDDEKEAMKQLVRKKIHRKRRIPKLWRNVAAAAVITMASITTIGIGFPTLASQIPIVNNIFSYFNDEEDGFYTEYEEFATGIGQVQTSNGITMAVDHAVYDGKTITLTYSVETEKELGKNTGVNAPVEVKYETGATGTSSSLKKIGDTQYVGMITSTPFFDSKQDVVTVKWRPRSIVNEETMKEIKGEWNFDFILREVKGEVQSVADSTSKDGIKVTINEIRSTDISTVIEYSQKVDRSVSEMWEWVTAELFVMDNLGNEYKVNGNGGHSENEQDFYWSATMGKINEQATSLFFTPEVILSEGSGQGHETLTLDPIEVKLEK
ncbi:DUF4179 domain-containing protein [Mammaliicoccus sciuri]|uniref:DUF4179 domain-containing protein n=2 Tax=Sporosarcina newyorkensis TaxID=759851 RepID=A0A1T4YC11_9BACL|nr:MULTISPECIES: DUF4179 domain-containing protein [Sporosarcina]EGQ26253.1 ECF-type sigma factor negative effector [Sporosarcina newyorkensis 2681]MBY0223692.1 DUF4179 domain-containing protein [Sporosarcina aquimarina]SKA98785.1 protein of unknown function [Sporosarcina newyorkensis]